ncbi:ArsR family transcriptional regulator [Testudinibacter sp. P27/CKL/0425]
MGRRQQEQRRAPKDKRQAEFKRSTNGQSYSALRKDLVFSDEFCALSGNAVKLMNILMASYNGKNNGDLAMPQTEIQASKIGMSPTTFKKSLKELLDSKFIEVSRRGGKNQCSLYALTCYKVDRLNNQTELSPTSTAKDSWKRKPRSEA